METCACDSTNQTRWAPDWSLCVFYKRADIATIKGTSGFISFSRPNMTAHKHLNALWQPRECSCYKYERRQLKNRGATVPTANFHWRLWYGIIIKLQGGPSIQGRLYHICSRVGVCSLSKSSGANLLNIKNYYTRPRVQTVYETA